MKRSFPLLLALLCAAPAAQAQVTVNFATGAQNGRTTTTSVYVGRRGSSTYARGSHGRTYRAPRPTQRTATTYRAPRPTHRIATCRTPRPTYGSPSPRKTTHYAPQSTCRTPRARSGSRVPRRVVAVPQRTPSRVHFDHRDGSTTVVSRRSGQPVRVTYRTQIDGRSVWVSAEPGANMTSPGTGRILSRDLPPTGRTAYPRGASSAVKPTPRPLAPRLYAALQADDLLEACRLASWADGSSKRQQILERAMYTQLPSPSVLANAARALRGTGWHGLPGRDTLLRVLEGPRPPSRP